MRRRIPKHVKQLAVELRKNQTIAEQIIWSKIRNKKLGGFRFTRQYSIGRYIADFYCSKANKIVEIDGKVHEERDRKEYDKIREEVIKTHGIKIIRFTNDEIVSNLEEVLRRLLEILNSSSQVHIETK